MRNIFCRSFFFLAALVLAAAGCRPVPPPLPPVSPARTEIAFRAQGERFEIRDAAGAWRPLFLQGVNLGAGIPGSGPNCQTIPEEHYALWFRQMTELGANCLRVYNLQSPAFYHALAAHNRANAATPLYLIQGVWLEDTAPPHDLTVQTAAFDAAGEQAVRRVHGADPAAATPDVSRWTCAFLIGREVMPEEVRATDDRRESRGDDVLSSPRTPLESGTATGLLSNTGIAEAAGGNGRRPGTTPQTPATSAIPEVKSKPCLWHPPGVSGGVRTTPPDFTLGRHFRLADGTRTERWIVARLEHLVAFERAAFGTERPVGFSSWPPLDPLRHPTESRDSGEDIAAVDLANLEAVDAPAGFFVSYHVYPYNPDFMNEDPGYQQVRDADGPNPYLGYLRDLKAHYRGVPLLMAEFGVPSNWGCARFNPAGMGHGGHDEAEQARVNVRLLRSIRDSGCAGAVYFSWLDEWWKGNWITRKLNFPQERRRLWHNLCDPEANYGLVAFEPPPPAFDRWPAVTGTGAVREIRADADAAYFRLRITLDRPPAAGETLAVGFDTYGDGGGENILPGGTRTARRCEFALVVETPLSRGDDVLSSPRTPLESGTATGLLSNTGIAEAAGDNGQHPGTTPQTPATSAIPEVKSKPCRWHPQGGLGDGRTPSPKSSASAQLYVTPAYDLCGIFHGTAGPEQLFHSVASSGGGWRPIRWQNAVAHASPDGRHTFPAAFFEIGRLRVATVSAEPATGATPSSLAAVMLAGTVVEIRLPYTLLQFTDPAALQVMDDNRATPERETAVSQGVAVVAAFRGSLLETGRFRWEPWNDATPAAERLKPAYFLLRNDLRNSTANRAPR